MRKEQIKKAISKSLLLLTATALVACGGGGSGDDNSFKARSSASATASGFVSGLNNVDLSSSSYLELYADETVRSTISGEDDWFVIWDAKHSEYKAVSLQYIRSIIYYDYSTNNNALADEFRDIETDDIISGLFNGDAYGDDYEVVTYNTFSDSYWGVNSGFEYEDETETTDVALMAGEQEKMKFYKKASGVSFAYNVDIKTAMSLVTLGTKVEKMLDKTQGGLTLEDQNALMGDLEKLAGVSFGEMLEAANDESKKDGMVSKIADKIGTSSTNLESKLLPELFGVEL